MKTFLHIIFIGSIILLMLLTLIPAIIVYMFTGYFFIDKINIFASQFEKKHFNDGN
jgi:hypothetical protein